MNVNVLSYERSTLNQLNRLLPSNVVNTLLRSQQIVNNPLSAVHQLMPGIRNNNLLNFANVMQYGFDSGQLPIKGMLLQLGNFKFASGYANLESLERTSDYRWAQQDRILREPAQQFIGVGSDSITLSGLLVPAYQTDKDPISSLRDMASKGDPYLLTSGFGKVYGDWVITQIKHTGTDLDASGKAGWVTFNLSLKAYGDDK